MCSASTVETGHWYRFTKIAHDSLFVITDSQNRINSEELHAIHVSIVSSIVTFIELQLSYIVCNIALWNSSAIIDRGILFIVVDSLDIRKECCEDGLYNSSILIPRECFCISVSATDFAQSIRWCRIRHRKKILGVMPPKTRWCLIRHHF